MSDILGRVFLIGALACFGLLFATSSGVWIGPAAVLGVLWLIVHLWNKSADTETRNPNEPGVGTARFATAPEVLAKCHSEGRGALVPLGKINGKPAFHRTEKHVLLLVSAGGGKGVSYIVPNLLSYSGSVFVTDPKGENASLTASFRSTLGKVCVLDPWGIAEGEAVRHRVKFNPLDALIAGDRRRLWSKAKGMTDAFGVVKQNDHWQNASKQLLTALIAHVCTAEDLGMPRDLVTVRELLMENFLPALEPEKGKPKNLKKGEENLSKPARALSALEAMLRNDACEGAIRREATGLLRCAAEELSGILGTAKVATEFIDETCIRDSLRGYLNPFDDIFDSPGLNFEDWRNGVLSVYLCVPGPEILNYPNYVRLVTVAALNTMLAREAIPAAGPVQFVLDELGYIGKLESVEGALGLGRSYGIQVWGVFQNLGMIQRDYGQTGPDIFWSNAGVRIAFATSSETSDYVSKQTGASTVTTFSTSYNEGPGGASSGSSTGESGRPLYTPHEVSTRVAGDSGKALVFLDGLNVAVVDRLNYRFDEPFASRASKLEKA